ncbi:MAG: hypothetical protein RL616_804, partial [Verrucomicrobiota bacterium]
MPADEFYLRLSAVKNYRVRLNFSGGKPA